MPQPKFAWNPSINDMPKTADVVIIGGGPAGTAALWALERFAPAIKTVLIESNERLGAGSSTASLENYRTCWTALCLAKQLERSVEVFHHANEYLGDGAAQAIAVKERGYLFCAFNEAQAQQFKADIARLHDIGLKHIEYLDSDEVAYRFGWLGNRVIAAKYDPIAGWLDSNALIYQFARSSVAAQILLGVSDASILTQRGRVTGVQTPNGRIASPNVVIACGANARKVGRSAGVGLPIILRPRQSFTTGWRHQSFPEHAPMIIGAEPYPHVRPEAQSGAIFGWEYNWHNKSVAARYGTNQTHDAIIEPLYPLDRLKDARMPSITLMLLARHFHHKDGEGFADARYLQGISHNIGYYVYRDETVAYRINSSGNNEAYTSERAIIDAVPNIKGLFVSIAHAGHGIMSSPSAGEILACKVLDLPLPDPIFSQFGLNTNWVEYDESIL
jgi:glycine/D-amino acid oxidase-like deaminating enzyme